MPGDVAGGEAAEPREREHAVGVVLADAGATGPRLGGCGRDRGRFPVVAKVLVDTRADELRQLEPGRTVRLELGRSRSERVIRPGQPRGLREPPVRRERLGIVRAVRARLALDDDPARELDIAIDALQRQVEDDVPERVVGALGVHVRPRHAKLVGDEALVVMEVGRYDHQALAERRDRARVLVAERLVDQDRGASNVLPVDLVVVDRPERRDQVAQVQVVQCLIHRPEAPPRPIRPPTQSSRSA